MDLRKLPGPSAVTGLMTRPSGITGRYRPFYFLNVIERLAGTTRLEDAVRGKVVLVTGASSGIGAATAHQIGAAGGIALLVSRTRESLEEVRDEIEARGGTAYVHPADLTDMEDIDRVGQEVLEEHGHVDVLVNNAGKSIRRSIELSYERLHDFERTMQLNYFG